MVGTGGRWLLNLLFLLLFLALRLFLRYKDIAQGERDNQIGQVAHKVSDSFQELHLSLFSLNV